MSEFIRYYESYVWSSYWSEYFLPFASTVLVGLFFVLCLVYLLTGTTQQQEQFTKRQKKWCSIVLLLGMGILLQDIFHAYRHIGRGQHKYVVTKSAKVNSTDYPNQLYSVKGELLDDKEILLKGYYSFDFPTTYLGESIQMLVRKQYTYGAYFPFVVTGRTDTTFTVRVSPPDNFQAFSEEIVLSQEESDGEYWYLSLDPYEETETLWNRKIKMDSSSE